MENCIFYYRCCLSSKFFWICKNSIKKNNCYIVYNIYKTGAIGFLVLGSGETEVWASNNAKRSLEGEQVPLNETNESQKNLGN